MASDVKLTTVAPRDHQNRPTPKSFICFFCERTFTERSSLQEHQDSCRYRPRGLEFLRFPPTDLQEQASTKSKRRHEQRAFLQGFGLITTGKAEVLNRQRRPDVECDDVIVVDDDDDDSDDDDVILAEEGDDHRNGRRAGARRRSLECATRKQAEKLLRIDVSSALGRRLRRHTDRFETGSGSRQLADRDYEPFLTTAIDTGAAYDETAAFGEPVSETGFCLRFSSSRRKTYEYPVTWRAPATTTTFCHTYRFGRRQRRRFCRLYDSGLNARSRRLAAALRRRTCSVRLERLGQPPPPLISAPENESTVVATKRSPFNAAGSPLTHGVSSVTDGRMSEATLTSSSPSSTVHSPEDSSDVEPMDVADIQPKSVIISSMSTAAPGTVSRHAATGGVETFPCRGLQTRSQADRIAACWNAAFDKDNDDDSEDETLLCRPLVFRCTLCSTDVRCPGVPGNSSRRAVAAHYRQHHGIDGVTLSCDRTPDGRYGLKLTTSDRCRRRQSALVSDRNAARVGTSSATCVDSGSSVSVIKRAGSGGGGSADMTSSVVVELDDPMSTDDVSAAPHVTTTAGDDGEAPPVTAPGDAGCSETSGAASRRDGDLFAIDLADRYNQNWIQPHHRQRLGGLKRKPISPSDEFIDLLDLVDMEKNSKTDSANCSSTDDDSGRSRQQLLLDVLQSAFLASSPHGSNTSTSSQPPLYQQQQQCVNFDLSASHSRRRNRPLATTSTTAAAASLSCCRSAATTVLDERFQQHSDSSSSDDVLVCSSSSDIICID